MLEFKKIVTLKEIACVATVFCYVFSFYIIGPITSSVIIAVPFLYLYLHDKAYFHQDVYSVRTLSFLTFIIFAGLAYSALHVTFDYSYVKTMFGQMIHLSMGIVIVTELRRRYHITAFDIEKYIVYAFFVQSIIEIVASVTPPLPRLCCLSIGLMNCKQMKREDGDWHWQREPGGVWGLPLDCYILFM